MKHLKTYESKSFEKYIVWKITNRLIILETLDWDDDGGKFRRLFRYDKDEDKTYPMTKEDFYFSNEKIENNVVYTSNDINKCLDVDLLNSIFSSNKYNL